MKKFFLLTFFLSVIIFPFQKSVFSQTSVCKNSVCFDASQKISGREIPLRGVDLLEYLRFDLYTAAFYVPPEANSIDQILGNIPKSLILNYHRGIKKEWMIRASRNRIRKNPEINAASLEERLKQLDQAYQTVRKNDRYELKYEPGIGTSLILNGKLQTIIVGEDFQRAFFGIWLSQVPLNEKLRDALISAPKKKN